MNVVSLSLILSLKEIQRIRTRPAPFQTIHCTSAASEEALFRIAPKVWLPPQALYKPTLIVIAFKQIVVFVPLDSQSHFTSLHILESVCTDARSHVKSHTPKPDPDRNLCTRGDVASGRWVIGRRRGVSVISAFGKAAS
jgi:hypothetical protein